MVKILKLLKNIQKGGWRNDIDIYKRPHRVGKGERETERQRPCGNSAKVVPDSGSTKKELFMCCMANCIIFP